MCGVQQRLAWRRFVEWWCVCWNYNMSNQSIPRQFFQAKVRPVFPSIPLQCKLFYPIWRILALWTCTNSTPRKFPPVHFIVCCFIIFSLFHALFSPRIIFPYVPCCCSKRWERKLTLYPLTSSAISCFYVSTTKYRGSFLFDLSFSCKHFLSGSSQSSFFFCPFILLTAIHNMHTFSEKNKHFVYFSFICLFSLSFLFLLPLLFLCFFLSFLSSSTQLSLPAWNWCSISVLFCYKKAWRVAN